jgi:hypothetical protein
MHGKNSLFVDYISNILHFASKRIYLRFDEESRQQMFYLTALPFTGYDVKIETESPDGYVDLSLMPTEATLANFFHIIEFKYLKVKKLTKAKVEKVWQEGLDQIRKYQQYPPYSDLYEQGKLKKWIVVFSTHRVLVNQEIIDTDDPNIAMDLQIEFRQADKEISEET